MAENYTQRLMKTDHEKSRDAVLAERRRCAAIARAFAAGDAVSELDVGKMLAGAAIAKEIERGCV